MIDLSSRTSVMTALFVKISVPTLGDLKFSNYYRPYTVAGDSYTSLGSLLSVGSSVSELRPSDSDIDIVISGIPVANMDAVLDYKIKGSPIVIRRVLFDPVTYAELVVSGNPAIKFQGLITNFALQEDFDSDQRTSTVSIQFSARSNIAILRNRVAGRRTNPDDMKKFYPNDPSFDRVPSLVGANFDFGAPQRAIS